MADFDGIYGPARSGGKITTEGVAAMAQKEAEQLRERVAELAAEVEGHKLSERTFRIDAEDQKQRAERAEREGSNLRRRVAELEREKAGLREERGRIAWEIERLRRTVEKVYDTYIPRGS